MPELPEVETVRRIVEPQIAGRTIIRVTLNRPDIISFPSPEAFRTQAAGAVIQGMKRRGKYLFICLEDGREIILHLRMTGCLLVTPPDFPLQTHTHLVFCLDNQTEIRFVDQRRFGRFILYDPAGDCPDVSGSSALPPGLINLGPEPFAPEFCADYLRKKIGTRRRPIKECLLDQSVVAGIGNIYGDEILYETGISPARPAASLSAQEWDILAEAIPSVLQKHIDYNRMTPEEYLSGLGKEYRNDPFLLAYGHDGTPCPKCGTLFKKIVISGRSSCFCPKCQKG